MLYDNYCSNKYSQQDKFKLLHCVTQLKFPSDFGR
jgi:hypothetical protein